MNSVNNSQPDNDIAVKDPPSVDNSNASAIEKLSFNLNNDPSSRAFNVTLRWVIFRIVEANKAITYVQLKKILRGEYGIDKRLIDTAISSLTSNTLFNAIVKWRNPRMENVGAEIGIHLYVRERGEQRELFDRWLEQVAQEFPELLSYTAPVIKKPRS